MGARFATVQVTGHRQGLDSGSRRSAGRNFEEVKGGVTAICLVLAELPLV